MAWESYLIDPLLDNNGLEIDGKYISNFSSNSKFQSKVSTSIGGMNEFVFSIGGSYQEKLYIFYLCDIGHKYNSENCINLESYSGKMNS